MKSENVLHTLSERSLMREDTDVKTALRTKMLSHNTEHDMLAGHTLVVGVSRGRFRGEILTGTGGDYSWRT